LARKPLICGNWKLNYGLAETRAELSGMLAEANSLLEVDLAIAPVATVLALAAETVSGSRLGLAAQNVHFQDKGAFTGEWACHHLNELSIDYAIVGHSERRESFGETSANVGKKVRACLDNGITPIACIGESLQERESGQLWDVLKAQLDPIMAAVKPAELDRLVIAYEPVWAIGTGKTASAAQAQEVHAQLRAWLAVAFEAEGAARVRLLYGGSVKPGNTLELMRELDVDGALVGGASLKADSFLGIARAAQEVLRGV
jgi:triosephosphate isomerase (TIM)